MQKNQDLKFEVKVADDVPEELIPQAAIVKVVYWSVENNKWAIVTEHDNINGERKPGIRVDIDKETRKASGEHHVWVNELLKDGSLQPYGYRIIITALTEQLLKPIGTVLKI